MLANVKFKNLRQIRGCSHITGSHHIVLTKGKGDGRYGPKFTPSQLRLCKDASPVEVPLPRTALKWPALGQKKRTADMADMDRKLGKSCIREKGNLTFL